MQNSHTTMLATAALSTVIFGVTTLLALIAVAIWRHEPMAAFTALAALGAGYFCQLLGVVYVMDPGNKLARVACEGFQLISICLGLLAFALIVMG